MYDETNLQRAMLLNNCSCILIDFRNRHFNMDMVRANSTHWVFRVIVGFPHAAGHYSNTCSPLYRLSTNTVPFSIHPLFDVNATRTRRAPAATVKNSDRRFFGWRGARGGSLGPPAVTMATPLGILRDCTHPSLNETLKSHNNVTFKLVKTGEYCVRGDS